MGYRIFSILIGFISAHLFSHVCFLDFSLLTFTFTNFILTKIMAMYMENKLTICVCIFDRTSVYNVNHSCLESRVYF